MSRSSLSRATAPHRKNSALHDAWRPRWRALFLCTVALAKAAAADQDWANVGGDKGHQRYSNLDQINRNNVATLQVAWTFHASDAGTATTIECTPLVIGGVMYSTTAFSKVVALDAENVHERLNYDPC